jgi:hypothetical protein
VPVILFYAVFLGGHVLDGDYVKRIQKGDFAVGVLHINAAGPEQDEFWVRNRIFMAIGRT